MQNPKGMQNILHPQRMPLSDLVKDNCFKGLKHIETTTLLPIFETWSNLCRFPNNKTNFPFIPPAIQQ